ncbi:MAG: DUF2905 domain-containing protein [Verrucomicrobiota bacterium]
MQPMKPIGIIIMIAGIALMIFGALFLVADKIPFLGNLPGDIHIRGRKWSVWFPVTTCILLSIILTLLLNLFARFLQK